MDKEMRDFKEHLEKTGISKKCQKIFIKAAEERYAWSKIGSFESGDNLNELIIDFGRYSIKSECCWINKRGELFYLQYASHERVASHIFGKEYYEMEKECARVGREMDSVCEAWAQVERPTKRMKEAVWKHMLEWDDEYEFCKALKEGEIFYEY